ncbi:MAG: tryptophan--tRNA ligase [Acidimicrobiales bacterium]|nr:MAG: tryptophan--tRNA ligase [Acidimicrobiales bacterium]
MVKRVFSGTQPTGELHIGGYLGAFRGWVEMQHTHDAFYCVVDLHALTAGEEPTRLRRHTLEVASLLLAVGLDPDACTLFVQSHVPEHAQLSWLLECTATMGELGRMTQYKDKAAGRESVPAGLFTYPVLMAADILLYDADEVPVGEDQRQHLELARDLASRFNSRYGPTFVVPEAIIPPVGARVMDLAEPTRKMSKSTSSSLGTIRVLDDPATIERKVRRAVTDIDTEVRYDRGTKPGVSNLVELLAVATGRSREEAAASQAGYASLKAATAEALIEMLHPVQERYVELAGDPAGVRAVLEKGAAKAREVAGTTVSRASQAMGLLPPGRS